MNRIAMVLVALLAATDVAFGENELQEEKDPKSLVVMSVPMLLASKTALARFQKDQPEADLKNFFVATHEETTYFEVVFYPRPNETKIVHKGNGKLDELIMDNPSGNQYGRSIGYDVSKDEYTIIKRFYSK